MTAPTIRLATEDDFRAINSQNVAQILEQPHLYIPTDDGDVMRSWGVAGTYRHGGENNVHETERLYPGSHVAPKFQGERISCGDLLYNGADPAADFIPRL